MAGMRHYCIERAVHTGGSTSTPRGQCFWSVERSWPYFPSSNRSVQSGTVTCPGSVPVAHEEGASLDRRGRRATHTHTPRGISCRGAPLSTRWKNIARKSMSCSEQPTRDRSAARSNTHNASPEVALAEHDRPRHATVLPGGGSAAERCDVYQIRCECLSLRRVALRSFASSSDNPISTSVDTR